MPCRAKILGDVRVLAGLLIAIAVTGCHSVIHQTGAHLWSEGEYTLTNKRIDFRIRKAADCAFRDFMESCPDRSCAKFSRDFANGFRAGFERFARTGSHLPPVIPPKPYRGSCYVNSKGAALAAQWFDGFQTGAAIADEVGIREHVTLPVSVEVAVMPESPPFPIEELPIEKPPIEEVPIREFHINELPINELQNDEPTIEKPGSIDDNNVPATYLQTLPAVAEHRTVSSSLPEDSVESLYKSKIRRLPPIHELGNTDRIWTPLVPKAFAEGP